MGRLSGTAAAKLPQAFGQIIEICGPGRIYPGL